MHYADTETPAITRRELRGHWAYFGPDGDRITDRDEIDRLNAIGLPPAYGDAWFAADASRISWRSGSTRRGGSNIATDPDFTARRGARKFDHCAAFGARLPKIRERVEKDLAKRSLTAERAIASIVRLLDSGRDPHRQ